MATMTWVEAFDLIDAGEGRWLVNHHSTPLVAGRIWRTINGFTLFDWHDRRLGEFPSRDEALRFLVQLPSPESSRPHAMSNAVRLGARP
jgi:hypothetical protein